MTAGLNSNMRGRSVNLSSCLFSEQTELRNIMLIMPDHYYQNFEENR